MSDLDHKEALHKAMRHAALTVYADYVQEVLADGSIEDKRKLVELSSKIAGLEVKEKVDPYANLNVVNITIQSGSVITAEQVVEKKPVAALEVVEEVKANPVDVLRDEQTVSIPLPELDFSDLAD